MEILIGIVVCWIVLKSIAWFGYHGTNSERKGTIDIWFGKKLRTSKRFREIRTILVVLLICYIIGQLL